MSCLDKTIWRQSEVALKMSTEILNRNLLGSFDLGDWKEIEDVDSETENWVFYRLLKMHSRWFFLKEWFNETMSIFWRKANMKN